MSISQKKKACKGTYKTNHFPGCKEVTYAYKFGLCKSCFIEWVYSTGEGSEYLKKSIIPQAKKDVKAKSKAKDAKLREDLKTLSQLENEAKKPFQKYIRLRDADLPCISCGTYTASIFDGGHFYKAEIYSGLIFNEDNCHKQCRKCNSFLGGNENNYRLGLIDRYGENFVLNLDRLAISQRNYRYSREELKTIKKRYQTLIKQ